MSYSGKRKSGPRGPIITREFCWICRRRSQRERKSLEGGGGVARECIPLVENLIKSNFHLFKKKHAREREEHLALSSLRHPWGGVLGLGVGVQGQSPNSLLLSIPPPRPAAYFHHYFAILYGRYPPAAGGCDYERGWRSFFFSFFFLLKRSHSTLIGVKNKRGDTIACQCIASNCARSPVIFNSSDHGKADLINRTARISSYLSRENARLISNERNR